MSNEDCLDEVQRWTARRRAALVLTILKGEASVQEAARKHGLTVAEVESWKERYLVGAGNVLRSPKGEESQKDTQIHRLERKVGQMTMDLDIMKEAVRPYRPLDERTQNES